MMFEHATTTHFIGHSFSSRFDPKAKLHVSAVPKDYIIAGKQLKKKGYSPWGGILIIWSEMMFFHEMCQLFLYGCSIRTRVASKSP